MIRILKRSLARNCARSYSKSSLLVVYTDGACSGNGTVNAKGGIGVVFPDGSYQNVQRPLEGVQTNIRAEARAILEGLEACRSHRGDVEVRTDSKFMVDTLSNWNPLTMKNYVNYSDYQEIMNHVASRQGEVKFTHVRGHSDCAENNQADRLARNAARQSRMH